MKKWLLFLLCLCTLTFGLTCALAGGMPVVSFEASSGSVDGGFAYTLKLKASEPFTQETTVGIMGSNGATLQATFAAGSKTASVSVPFEVTDTHYNVTYTLAEGEGYQAKARAAHKLTVYNLPHVEFYNSVNIGRVSKQMTVQVNCRNANAILKDNNVFELRDQSGALLATAQWRNPRGRLAFKFDVTPGMEGLHNLSVWLGDYCVTPNLGYCTIVDTALKPLTTLDTNGAPYMSITLDCGFNGRPTDEILAVLDKYNVKATFFMTGYFLNNFPEEAKRIRDAGHEIGNHSYTHPRLLNLDPYKRMREIVRPSRLCEDVLGVTPRLFRPPYGNTDYTVTAIARAAGMEVVMWSIDSHDWDTNMSREKVVSRVTRNIVPGTIILFHLDGRGTAKTLDEVIPYYTEELGLTLVPVSELMSYAGRELPPLPNE